MSDMLWSAFTTFAAKTQINTLLFGTLEDDCHGTILLKVIVIVINFLLGGVLLIGTIGIIISGMQIIAARDDANMVTKAKQRIIDIAIGIAAFVLMFVVLNFVIPGGITLDGDILANGDTCPEVSSSGGSSPDDSGDPDNPDDPDDDSDNIEHGVRSFKMCGMDFYVVKIQVDGIKDDGSDSTGIKKYLKDKVAAYHINGGDGKIYNLSGSSRSSNAQKNHRDAVARNMAYDMYYDALTADSCSAGKYDREPGFSTVVGDDGFKKTYTEIMAGKPVVHYFTADEGGTNPQPYYAVIVGVKKNADKNNLSNGDFLFVDTYGDGILWNNITNVPGGYKTASGGDGCHTVQVTNRYPDSTNYYVPSSKTGKAKQDCGI